MSSTVNDISSPRQCFAPDKVAWTNYRSHSSRLRSEYCGSSHSAPLKLSCIRFYTHLWKYNAPVIHTARTNDLFRYTPLLLVLPVDHDPGLASIILPPFPPPLTPPFPSPDGDADAFARALAVVRTRLFPFHGVRAGCRFFLFCPFCCRIRCFCTEPIDCRAWPSSFALKDRKSSTRIVVPTTSAATIASQLKLNFIGPAMCIRTAAAYLVSNGILCDHFSPTLFSGPVAQCISL